MANDGTSWSTYINTGMRAHEFIIEYVNEARKGQGGSMIHGIDPLANTMHLFGKPRKAKRIPDAPDAPYSRYPKRMYATARMITPEQRDALEASDEFKKVRKKWIEFAAKADPKLNINSTKGKIQHMMQDVVKVRAKILKKVGLPII